jgi:hypothetical protein
VKALLKFASTALAVAVTVQGTSMHEGGGATELSAAAPNERARSGMTLQRFALVSPFDVYGRYASRLTRLEGTMSLGTVFGSGLDALRGASAPEAPPPP